MLSETKHLGKKKFPRLLKIDKKQCEYCVFRLILGVFNRVSTVYFSEALRKDGRKYSPQIVVNSGTSSAIHIKDDGFFDRQGKDLDKDEIFKYEFKIPK